MSEEMIKKIELLRKKGVKITRPETVEIGAEVDPERVSAKGVVIHPGCRISGKTTLIMEGARIGEEGPATVRDCQIGPEAELKGGVFSRSVFLRRSSMGDGARVREGCILEEEAGGAQAVGIKQTILFPFVTLGSLVNFCDCLMAGGTSRKDHSEVGSSYIHFNYTPNQDKATASILGDVPRGVMLDQLPIFLGGQGGLAGPARIGFGTVIAAGTICRRDCPEGGKLLLGGELKKKNLDFTPGVYWRVSRKTLNNINFIANIFALRQWYLRVRSLFSDEDFLAEELRRGALETLEITIEERIKRFRQFAEKAGRSAEIYRRVMGEKASARILEQKKELSAGWPRLEELLVNCREKTGDCAGRDAFLQNVERAREEKGGNYITVIRSLDDETRGRGIAWLQGLVEDIEAEVLEIIPSFK